MLVTNETIPDRVAIDPKSPHHWPRYRKLGVRVDGVIRRGDVVEFCVSEGWAMVQKKDAFGRKMIDPETGDSYLLEKVEGVIEPYYLTRDQKQASGSVAELMTAAEQKRLRKNAKRLRDAT